MGGPEDIMRTIAEHIPGGTYTPVPHAAHIANLQNPEGFNQILHTFFMQA